MNHFSLGSIELAKNFCYSREIITHWPMNSPPETHPYHIGQAEL